MSDPRISRLPCSKSSEGVAADFVERTNLVGTVDCAGADTLRREARVIQDFEVFDSELKAPAFRDGIVLGKLHVPVGSVGKTKSILADIAKRTENQRIVDGLSRIVSIRNFGRLKSGRIEPAPAVYLRTACGRTVGTNTCDKRAPVISNPCAGEFATLQDGDPPAAPGGDDPAQLIVTEQMVNQGPGTLQAGRLPDIRAGEHVGVIETRRPVVKLVAVRNAQRKSRVAGVEAGDALTEGKVVKALGVGVVGQNGEAVCVAVTCAPATAAPTGSITLPTMLPKPCACEKRGAKGIAKKQGALSSFVVSLSWALRDSRPAILTSLGVPGDSTTRPRITHQELNKTRNPPDDFLDSSLLSIVSIVSLKQTLGVYAHRCQS